MTASAADIKQAAAAIRARYPTLATGAAIRFETRLRLEELAALAGVPAEHASDATVNELISLFLVAEKNPASAVNVGGKITTRVVAGKLTSTGAQPPLSEPPLSEPPLSEPFAPTPSPQWPPSKADPLPGPEDEDAFEAVRKALARARESGKMGAPSGPAVSLDQVKELVKEVVRDGALKPLQQTLEDFDKSVREDFKGYLSSNRDVILDDVRGALRDIAAEELRKLGPTRLEITLANEPPKALGLVHKKTPQILSALAAGLNVYLHGPAGSGKTTSAHKCAEALGVEFYFAAKVESEYQLTGFKDARGETVRTQFRDAYERGGVFLFDEMDASAPSAVVAMNAALANGFCAFPDGIVKRHEKFYCIGAGNTKLTGATRAYAGRNQLDAASIDRFAFIEFGYDDELERALATNAQWCKYVQRVRAVVAERGISHLVTPRATYDGCKLLASGFDHDTTAGMVVYKGLDDATRTQIEQAL